MSGVPRSQSLLRHAFTAAGFSPAWTTPVNTVTLVKSLYAGNAGSVAADLQMSIGAASGGPSLVMADLSLAGNGEGHWEGWFVLNPGDVLFCYCNEASVTVWVSGAVLQGAPLYPPAT